VAGLAAKPEGFHSLRLGEAVLANPAFENCSNCTEARVKKKLIGSSSACFTVTSLIIDGRH